MLIAIMIAAILLLLLLIIKFKVHAFVALIIVSLLTALAAGIPVEKILPTLLGGFGNTLAAVALLVGLGAMIGRLLEITGGAKVLADTLINKFGEQKAPFALGVAALLFGFPIFFDAGLVVMLPIVFSVAKRFGGSVLRDACLFTTASGPGSIRRFARRKYGIVSRGRFNLRNSHLVYRYLFI